MGQSRGAKPVLCWLNNGTIPPTRPSQKTSTECQECSPESVRMGGVEW